MPLDPLNKTLLCQLSDHRFHSGTGLAAALGVSRTAVWKHIRDLEALGLEIAAVSGKGYRLISPLQLLDEAAIRADLTPAAAALLAELEIHDSLDSTNTYLMQAALKGPATGTVCLAETQTAGRGRIGREWLSPFGSNIYLSLLWRFEDPSRVAGLSLAVGVAVVRALAGLGFGEAGLKWPNDVLWGENKLGGILLEVAGEAHGSCAVVIGVGLNRYLPASVGRSIDQAWADLTGIAGGVAPPRNRLVAALLNELLVLVADYEDYGLAPWLPEWRRLHRLQGREAVVHIGETQIRGRIAGVSDEGLLVLDCGEGGLRRFASGEVRLRVTGD